MSSLNVRILAAAFEPQQRQHYVSGSFFKSVFWIRQVLIWLQNRIRGFTGLRIQIRLRLRILLFSLVALKIPTKISFFVYFLLTIGTFTSVFNDNKLLRGRKTIKLKVCLFLLVDRGNRVSKFVKIITDPDPGVPKTYKSNGSGSGTLVSNIQRRRLRLFLLHYLLYGSK